MKIFELQAFSNVYKKIKTCTFPIKTTYQLVKLGKKIEEELNFYQETYTNIIKEYGKTDENGEYIFSEDGNSIVIKDGMEALCQEKVRELETFEIDLSDFSFTIDDFANVELTPEELNALMPIIAE